MGVDTCNCGARLVPSVRYDATGPHETLACFEGRPECLTGAKPRIRYCSQCERVLKSKQLMFCSLECRYAAGTTRVAVTCPCGAVFTTLPSIRERGKGRYCSLACSHKARKHATLAKMVAVDCPCGKLFLTHAWYVRQGKSRYCSVSCGRRYGVRQPAASRLAS